MQRYLFWLECTQRTDPEVGTTTHDYFITVPPAEALKRALHETSTSSIAGRERAQSDTLQLCVQEKAALLHRAELVPQ